MPGWTVCLAFPVVLPGPTSASGSLRLTAGPWQVLTTYDNFPEAYTAETETKPSQWLLHAARDPGPGRGRGRSVDPRRRLRLWPLSAALHDRGAVVTGLDSSAGILKLGRRRLGPGADLRFADLGSPLPFRDGAFDDVVAALVLHYLQDWTAPLAELRRVLKPSGRLIVSLDHPFAVNIMHPRGRSQARLFRDPQPQSGPWTATEP
jgi:SAM-dependent methyltransferase